jgi:hypothetical protein
MCGRGRALSLPCVRVVLGLVAFGRSPPRSRQVNVGIKPESAYYESLHETPLIANTIARKKLYEVPSFLNDEKKWSTAPATARGVARRRLWEGRVGGGAFCFLRVCQAQSARARAIVRAERERETRRNVVRRRSHSCAFVRYRLGRAGCARCAMRSPPREEA